MTDLQVVLAALKPSQYRAYWREWKGLSPLSEYEVNYLRKSKSIKDFGYRFMQIDALDTEEYLDLLDEILLHAKEYGTDIKGFVNKALEILKDPSRIAPNREVIRNVYEKLFGNKFRIVLPIQIKEGQEAGSFKEEMQGKSFYINCNRLAEIYFTGLGKEEEAEAIEEFLQRWNSLSDDRKIAEVRQIMTGKYRFRTEKREISLGKIFDTIRKKDFLSLVEGTGINYLAMLNDCEKKLFQRNYAKRAEDLVVVLSRHPYDIAGMSTDRGWTSCMNLVNGEFRQYVMSSMKYGVLIAYLCRKSDTTAIKDRNGTVMKNDKLNIQNPLGRVLVKPFYKDYDRQLKFNPPNFILRCSDKYGTFYDGVIKDIQEWLDNNWNQYIESQEEDTFILDDELFYRDQKDQSVRGGTKR